MSGLKSLLKYRFQPRESEKAPAENSNGNTTPTIDSPSSPGLTYGEQFWVCRTVKAAYRLNPAEPRSDTIQDVSVVLDLFKARPKNKVIPETPPSKQSSPGSPVFHRAKKLPAAIDSSSSEDSSKSNSPWLSKTNGVKSNGGVGRTPPTKRKYGVESPGPSSSSSSQASNSTMSSSQTPTSSEGRAHEMKQKVDSLKAMFPGCALWMLEDAAVATPDLETAIDLIISKNRVGASSRGRPSFGSQSSTASSGSDIGPPAKRARPLLSDSDVPNSQASQDNTTISSPTENMGSIKAIQAARNASRIRRDLMSTDEDEENETSSSATMPSTKTVTKREESKVATHNDDDGDDGEDVELDESDSEDEEAEEKDANPILSFFQSAGLDELMAMPGCSKKKAEVIIENRPYDDWLDLTNKFHEHKQLNINLVAGCKELLKMRKTVNALMKHCEQIAHNMEYVVSTLTNNTTLSQDDGYIHKQPDILESKYQLKPYQLVGLNWLTIMHRQDLNGILADEMGLGKTIQTVAFLAQLLQDGEKGPHVIVAPSSTVDNWLRELKNWCPKLKVILYYGSQEERRDIRTDILEGNAGEFHVIVTSYNMATGGIEDRILFKKYKFHYAIFDEGHMLKNMSSLRYQNLMKIRAQRRLLLTGTPLQNNLVELMSLLCFVMPEMFSGKTEHLKRMFTAITASTKSSGDKQGSYEKECVNRAKQILKPFFLRRVKTDVLKQLPDKKEYVENVPLAEPQYELYEELRKSFTARLETSSSLDNDLKSRGASMLMELRKAANHHLLHRRHYNDTMLHEMAPLMLREPTHSTANVDYIFEDMQVMSDFELHRLCKQYRSLKNYKLDDDSVTDSGKFRFLDSLLAGLKEKGSRVLLFSQFTMMLDIIEIYMSERGHRFLRLDGSTPVAERQDLIDRFNNDEDIFVFLLSTRAGGLGINLTAADVVVLHDIDFNPYNDKQAEDRCHRVGQTKNVSIYRLISKNTLEEAMYRCAQQKLKLEEDVTGVGSKKTEESSDVASLLKEALGVVKTK